MADPVPLGTPQIDPTAFVAPGVHLYGDVVVEAGAVIMFGTVIRAELDRITIGAHSNIQDNSVLHADLGVPCTVGSRVTVGHAAVIHGATVGDHCLIGIGARVLNRSVVGEGAWLAAGAVLPEGREIPPWTLAVGTPAKPVRELSDEEIARQRSGVEDYLRFAATYRRLFGTAP
jgi:carbonic anhydrase/acetyltransferase-like protein (isoleucine patch superfamily)